MLKSISMQTIFAIAFCEICEEYAILTNERSLGLDAETKISKHAANKHNYNKNGMRWTKDEREMVKIMRKSGFKEGYL
jgi:hypothetical protein